MSNFINKVFVETPINDENLELKVSVPTFSNTITLISGKNQTGKTHILQQIEQSIRQHNKNVKNNLITEFTPKQSSIYTQLDNNREKVELFSILDVRNGKKFIEKTPFKIGTQHNNLEYSIKTLSYKFLSDEINYIFNNELKEDIKSPFDKDRWFKEDSYRYEVMNIFHTYPDLAFPCNKKSDFVSLFEKAVNGQLCISADRMKSDTVMNLAFYIKYSDTQIFSFSDWSEGQKVLFLMLLISFYGSYDVLLIDELENNLHPEYMSYILEKLKQNVKQVIISSHNPHLIFSRLVDRVLYIDIYKEELRDRVKTNIPLHNDDRTRPKKSFPPFKRTVTYLDNDIDKMTSTYRLFDNFDNDLLKLSSITYAEINKNIVEELTKIFHYDAIKANENKSRADIQNAKLGNMLIAMNKEDLKILDYGAGLGRTYFEIKKENIPNKLGNHTYHFWEPDESNRDELKKAIQNTQFIEVIEVVENVQKDYYDVILLSNVVHECNSSDFATILKHCQYALKDDGQIIIIELNPLVSPEKYAVSYSEDELRKILDATDWKVSSSSQKLLITNKAIAAYWISAKKRNKKNLKINDIKAIIEKNWDEMEDKYASHYEGLEDIKSINDFNTIFNALTILASIVSNRNGRWDNILKDNFYKSLDNY